MIEVRELTKVYRVPVKAPGLLASLRSIYAREWREVRAVDAISFDIAPGERVGFLGPNGAGKTTTLKMLTGLLHPTSGQVRVAGHEPKSRDHAFLHAITLVMGQKQQLIWDLPPTETFELNRALYDIPRAEYTRTLADLVDLLDLGGFLDQPSRNLSLGQRMRCELAASLLHRPQVLFLDEPTIGLDVEVQALVREFIATYNARHGATVMLTSHDMQDVQAISQRIILIDKGVIRFDGTLEGLHQRFGVGRRISVRCDGATLASLDFVPDGARQVRTVDASDVNALLAEVLRRMPAADVTVSDPPLEEVMRRAFGESRSEDAAK